MNPMTVRQLLQNFGTECGRSVHTNFWINALFSDFDPKTPVVIPNDDFITKPKKYKNTVVPCKIPHWIITDCRFPNELESIESRDGVVLRINRNDNRLMENRHSSETALDCHQFKYVIDNNGTISELVEKVERVLKNIKIL
jgi:hypothetical protein